MSSRALLPLLMLLIACPTDEAAGPGAPTDGAPAGPPPEGPPPGGEMPTGADPAAAGAPGTPGEAPPEGTPTDATTPPDGAPVPPNDPNAMPKPPGLASLVKDGKTVKITGKLIGATKGQVDVQTVREDGKTTEPVLLEIIKVTDGTFSVEAPATFDRPIYITALVQAGAAPSPSDLGGAAEPIKLAGKDVAVEITVGKDLAWLKKLPWGDTAMKPIGDAPKPGAPPTGEAPAAGGAAPAAGGATPAGPG